MPERIQLSRRKGWRKPESTVVVARPSRWGNPIRIEKSTVPDLPFAVYGMIGNLLGLHGSMVEAREHVVEVFRNWTDSGNLHLLYPGADIAELRGKNLGCWCPLDQPCHADVLLELANGAPS
jgi:hypothetical protein